MCYSLDISLHWFSKLLGVIRRHAIIWTNFDPVPWCHMTLHMVIELRIKIKSLLDHYYIFTLLSARNITQHRNLTHYGLVKLYDIRHLDQHWFKYNGLSSFSLGDCLTIGPSGTHFSEISMKIQLISVMKMYSKMSAKWCKTWNGFVWSIN